MQAKLIQFGTSCNFMESNYEIDLVILILLDHAMRRKLVSEKRVLRTRY